MEAGDPHPKNLTMKVMTLGMLVLHLLRSAMSPKWMMSTLTALKADPQIKKKTLVKMVLIKLILKSSLRGSMRPLMKITKRVSILLTFTLAIISNCKLSTLMPGKITFQLS